MFNVEIPRPRDATELNNDGMMNDDGRHPLYETEPNLSIIFRNRSNQRTTTPASVHIILLAIDLQCHVFPF